MRLVTSPAFVCAVALLLLNDWVLKPAFPGWWTGKLSDFAGLFAFALFWSAVLLQWRRGVFALAVLVPAYGLARRRALAGRPPVPRWVGFATAAVALLAFAASSRSYPDHRCPPATAFTVPASREQVRTALPALGLPRAPEWTARRDAADTVVTHVRVDARTVWTTVELRDAAPCCTMVTLLTTMGTLSGQDIEKLKILFFDDVIRPLRVRFAAC
jgi:hypothetical protein